jgi:subtilisin family serine protease
MKEIFIAILIYCINLSMALAQNVQLRSNGVVSEFKAIDTLHYTEYKLEGKSATELKRQDPSTLILRQSFGKTSKKSPQLQEGVFYTTNYYAYSDGTLQAPTSQIFFKPVDFGKFEKEINGIGTVERHPFLDGYYFLNITDKKWLTGEKIFYLCNRLFELQLASVIEPVFVTQMKVENPLRPLQWNIRNNANVPGAIIGADMNVENAWNAGATGTGIRVAVIDDGVDLTHPDLVNNLLPGFDATGNNSGGAPVANNGHGTNCAGIIAATDNTDGVIGVAFNARIIPIRMAIVSADGFFLNLTETMKATCFNEAVNRGADIISCSWGGGSVSAQVNAAIQDAVNNGRGGRGCVVLFSAGNNNNAISAISSNQNVIAVGASSTCDTRKRSSSNPALVNPGVTPDPEGVSCDGEGWWGSSFGTGLDVIAPGVWISTTDNVGANGFVAGNFNDRFNGTSAACPNTAAVVALILSVNPNLTGIQARNILEQTCFKIPNGNFQPNIPNQPNGTWSNQAGHGRVNACQAVLEAYRIGNSVNGGELVCTNTTYTLQNAPNANLVTWLSSNPNGLSINPTSGVATRQNNFNGQATITATLGGVCGNNVNITRTIWVGNPTITAGTTFGPCGDLEYPFSGPTINGATYTWSINRTNLFLGFLNQNAYVALRSNTPYGGTSFIITLSVSSQGCTTTNTRIGTYIRQTPQQCGSGGGPLRTAFPNPTNDSFTVTVKDDNSNEAAELTLFNKSMERVYFIRTEEKEMAIPTSNLLPGVYYLNIVIGKNLTQQQIVVNH